MVLVLRVLLAAGLQQLAAPFPLSPTRQGPLSRLQLSAAPVPLSPAPQRPFPTRSTPPADVLSAQLEALQRADMARAYDLFSRAARLAIDEAACADVRQSSVSSDARLRTLERSLRESCPGIIGHDRCDILASLAVSEYDGRRLPQWRCRVRVLTGGATKCFTYHLTRQSDPPPPTIDFDEALDGARAIDGYEGCWFVWKIVPDEPVLQRVAAAQPAPQLLPV